ncbi:hypothetical protein OB236_04370 [Paenibacillus sp. WQ 127069]|uniref:Uncharacterized protein n=1 Tax=Paenibacillus baimaensis TaxID=2982185 RepID=A0ABT2U9Y3_9BACL|nr:hypothetical protein [Paenibacillus sp. WQ 127069]MCU6791362.1 hypothetical protein [Paenibacillus sp. WQ 127069]
MPYLHMKQRVKQLCDTLITYQVDHLVESWEGGIICPSCKRIHGRCGDAIFPMYYMAVETGEERYRHSAQKLVQFMKRNQLFDGSWLNDEPSTWKGTTVFQTLSLCHAYDYLNDNDEADEAAALLDMIEKAAKWITWAFCEGGIAQTNVNYFITTGAVLQWCSQILNNADYAREAKKLMYWSLEQINKDGFIIGEAKYTNRPHDNIDIGYNFDMSIGAMAEYYLLTGDTQVKEATLRVLRAHIQMIYPDGSMDNSFGSRGYKWTLYGSKTAHGCQMALMMLCDEDPAFAEAADRNAHYVASCMNKDGMVGYGPHHEAIFDKSCIHTTFNRADAFAVALVYGKPIPESSLIPSDHIFGLKQFPSLNTYHARTESLMATVTGFGANNAPTGGSISYLWHNTLGPLQIGSATTYERSEVFNMPEYPGTYRGTTTPRIEAVIQGTNYGSLYEYEAAIAADEDRTSLHVYGRLKPLQQPIQIDSRAAYSIHYRFYDQKVEKTYRFDVQFPMDRLSIIEPFVIQSDTSTARDNSGIVMETSGTTVTVKGEGSPFIFNTEQEGATIAAVFPAVMCTPVQWTMENVLPGNYEFTVSISVQ